MARAIPTHDPDRFEVDDLFEMSSHTMNRVLRSMSPEHKAKLANECLVKIDVATGVVCSPGHECADSRGITRFPNPYTIVKKYTYMYTVLAGWQSEADLEAREQEKFEREGISEEAKEAFRQKGWLK